MTKQERFFRLDGLVRAGTSHGNQPDHVAAGGVPGPPGGRAPPLGETRVLTHVPQNQLNDLKTQLYESKAKETKLQKLGLQWKQKAKALDEEFTRARLPGGERRA